MYVRSSLDIPRDVGRSSMLNNYVGSLHVDHVVFLFAHDLCWDVFWDPNLALFAQCRLLL
jgi:hypothetical protein